MKPGNSRRLWWKHKSAGSNWFTLSLRGPPTSWRTPHNACSQHRSTFFILELCFDPGTHWSWSTVFLILCTVEPADGAFLWQAPAFPRVPLRDYTTHNNNAAALFSAQFSITIHNSIAIAPFVTKKIPLTNSPVEPYVLVLTPFKSPVDIGCITALNIKSIELQSRVDGVDGRVVVGGVQWQCPCPRLLSYVASPPYTTPTQWISGKQTAARPNRIS